MYTPTDAEKEVIRIMQSEKSSWEEGLVWVTDKVQFVMKNVVLKCRKNYFGIFNEALDPITKREKIFIPLTEWTVETMLKNIDIDTNDIGVKARHAKAHLKAQIFRYILKKKLNDINFGKTLNQWLRRIAIDGTAFLKAYEQDGKLAVRVVDRLSMLFDPSVESLEDSNGKTERYILSKPEFDELKLNNSDEVEGLKTVDRVSLNSASPSDADSEIPFVELYERYGYWPKFCLTGNEEDRDKFFHGKAQVSNLDDSPVFHNIEEVKEDPYGEGKLKEVPNRGDGRGIAEMLFSIQAYLNEVINTRMTKARIVQLGLFKMTGNVTPQQFKRLFITGGIKLDGASDIEPLDTGRIDPSSYKDEEQAYLWGTRVTGTSNEDEVAGNRPATNALIEQQGTSKGYNLRIEDLMLNLAQFIQNKMLPIIKKELRRKRGDLERITGDPDIYRKLDKVLVEQQVYRDVSALTPFEKQQLEATGGIDMLIEQGMLNLKEMGNDRYIPLLNELFDTDFDIDIAITDENINRSVMAKMLQDTIGVLAGMGLPINNTLRELYDTLGLDADRLIEEAQQPVQQGQPQGQQPANMGATAQEMPQPAKIMQ